MYHTTEIKTAHIELTTRCNASCPMCPRNYQGAPNPDLLLSELSLSDIKKILPTTFLQQLKKILLCGNFGDPAAATECLEIVAYLKESNPQVRVELHSNGGLRNASWWRSLAHLVDLCHFGIDGLSDTNHLYRQGVSWDILIRNVESFIKAGGKAYWVFLVFAHNEHQVEQARQHSQTMGFQRFVLKSTSRFYRSATNQVQTSFVVKNVSGQMTHTLSPPQKDVYQNASLKELTQHPRGMEQYFSSCRILCKAQMEKSIYIDARGFVFPCCWLAGELYPKSPTQTETQQWMSALPLPQLSAKENRLEEILSSDFFQKHLPTTWNTGPSRLKVCAKTCGDQYKPFDKQFL